MISGFTLMPDFWHFGGGLKHGARLHLGDFRMDDAEAAAAETEHRVELVQFLHALLMIFSTGMPILRARSVCALSSCGRNSCSGGSRKRIVAGNPFNALKMPKKSPLLVRQEFRERVLPVGDVFGKDHLAHGVNAVALEEHVFGARQADARRAERERAFRSVPACRRWCGLAAA